MQGRVIWVFILLATTAVTAAAEPHGSRASAATIGGLAGPPGAPLFIEGAQLTEGFEDILSLTGDGWSMHNASDPPGITSWFQGNSGVFTAQAGGPTHYIGANFNNVAGTGTISTWLILPEQPLRNGDELAFWTRTVNATFPDRLEVRLSLAGASTDTGPDASSVGDFVRLLDVINPELTGDGYPTEWTRVQLSLANIPVHSSGRIALRYHVTDAGPDGVNSDYIGIDTLSYLRNLRELTVSAQPLPDVTVDAASAFATLLEADVAASGDATTLYSLTLRASDLTSSQGGVTLLDQTIANVRLFADQVATANLLQSSVAFGGDTVTLTFTPPLTLQPGDETTLIVTAEAAAGPSAVTVLGSALLFGGSTVLAAAALGLRGRRRLVLSSATALVMLLAACGSAPPVERPSVSFTAELVAIDTDAGLVDSLPAVGAAVTVLF